MMMSIIIIITELKFPGHDGRWAEQKNARLGAERRRYVEQSAQYSLWRIILV